MTTNGARELPGQNDRGPDLQMAERRLMGDVRILPASSRSGSTSQVDRRTGEEVGAWDQWKARPGILPFLRGYRKLLVIAHLHA